MAFPSTQTVSNLTTPGAVSRTFTRSAMGLMYRDESVLQPDSVTLQCSPSQSGPYKRSFRLKYNNTDITAMTSSLREMKAYTDITVLVTSQSMTSAHNAQVLAGMNELSALINNAPFLTSLLSGFS